jgi:hypothetical protein
MATSRTTRENYGFINIVNLRKKIEQEYFGLMNKFFISVTLIYPRQSPDKRKIEGREGNF